LLIKNYSSHHFKNVDYYNNDKYYGDYDADHDNDEDVDDDYDANTMMIM
jgi:hypothetical protein